MSFGKEGSSHGAAGPVRSAATPTRPDFESEERTQPIVWDPAAAAAAWRAELARQSAAREQEYQEAAAWHAEIARQTSAQEAA